jgi:cell division cycle 20-like protein 1 (cofactor of APC complex)
VSSGSSDGFILNRDPRENKNFFSTYEGHENEVCGLKWSFDGQQLASGGKDHKIMIWSIKKYLKPEAKFSNHIDAVKAIAWSPHKRGEFCSGGSTADKSIILWDSLTLKPLSIVNTGR